MEVLAMNQTHAPFLIQLLANAITRVQKNRWRFLATSLQVMLSISSSNLVDPREFPDPEELAQERFRSEMIFKEYIDCIMNFLNAFEPVDDQERNLLLQGAFQLLAKCYSLQDMVDVEYIKKCCKLIAKCSNDIAYIMEYDQRFKSWHEEKSKLDLYELSSDDEQIREEVNSFVQWSFQGIGVFLYLLFVKKVEADSFGTTIYSNTWYFSSMRPYIHHLFQSYLATMGKTLAKQIINSLPNNSIKSISGKTVEVYFDFVQIMINYMATTPVDKDRSEAFHLLDDYFSKFDDSGKFQLLEHTLKTCPFESFTGLMIHKLKDEIRFEYDAYLVKINHKLNSSIEKQSESNQPPVVKMEKETIVQLELMTKNSTFLRKESILLLIDVFKKYTEANVNTSDLLLEGFNLAYWLLLRDSHANITGIRNKDIIAELKKVIDPLKGKITETLKSIEKVLQEKKEFDELVKKELEEMENEEDFDKTLIEDDDEDVQFQKDTTSCRLNLWILQDLINKVETLLQ